MTSAAIWMSGTGAVCPVGMGVRQSWASVRSGISRIAESTMVDRRGDAMKMALVPDPMLTPLSPEFDELWLPAREERMLMLAAPALREAVANAGPLRPLPLFLGLPATLDLAAGARRNASFVACLSHHAQVPLDEKLGRVFPNGRASALIALEAAVQFLSEGRGEAALVGGVDSFLDPKLLVQLDSEDRLLGYEVSDGFIPGEGAAFALLTRSAGAYRPQPPAIAIAGVGSASDPGHRYSDQPARGEGLANALEALRSRMPGPPSAIGTAFGTLNGESFGAKEWGVARLRHADLFAPEADVDHPADCYGDTGAAAGALLLVLAHAALTGGHRPGPVLVWASSDREERACVLLSRMA